MSRAAAGFFERLACTAVLAAGAGAVLAFGAAPARAVCTYTGLASGSPVNIVGSPGLFSVSQGNNYWMAVGTRPLGGDDWDIQMYSSTAADPTCVSGQVAASSRTSGADFVIGDFNVNALGTYYPRVTKFSGSNSAQVEWDDGADLIRTNGPAVAGSMGATSVLVCYDVYLTSGSTYTFTLGNSGSADLRVLLFRNALGGTFWTNRNGAEFEATTVHNYTAPGTGYYGVVILNDNGGSSSYTLTVGTCSTPSALFDKSPVNDADGENYHSFTPVAAFWTVVGTLGATSDNDLDVYGTSSGANYPQCFTTPDASSTFGAGFVDYVVGDFNFAAPSTNYAGDHLYLDQGTPGAIVEWDKTSGLLYPNGVAATGSLGGGEIVRVWDVVLSAGLSYKFDLGKSGGGALNLELFRNPAPGAFWAGRTGAEWQTSSTFTYVAPASGYYALVLADDNNLAASYKVQVSSCDPLSALASGVSRATSFSEFHASFNQTDVYWTAIGARGTADWDVAVYQTGSGTTPPECFTNLLANSTLGVGPVDLVVGDFNWNPTGTYYALPHIYQDIGSPGGTIEWDAGADLISVGGPTVHRSTDYPYVLECWDVYLASGTTYTFRLNKGGTADYHALLFHNPGGTYWAGRAAAQFDQTTPQQTYTAPADGYYGLVVVNDNQDAGWYDIRVDAGTVSADLPPAPGITQLTALSPNPSRLGTRIDFALHAPGAVGFDVIDMSGRRVAALPDAARGAGTFSVAWDGRSDAGRSLPPGLYFVRMKVDGRPVGVRKLVLRE